MKNDIDGLTDFVNDSDTLCGVMFNGCYTMDFGTFLRIFEHYQKTGNNLLDTYSSVMYATWNKKSKDGILDYSEYSKLISDISIPLIQELFSKEQLEDVFNYANESYESFISINNKTPKKERSQACSYTAKPRIKELVYKLHGKLCLCCGATENLSLDHVIPIHKGGKNELDNLQPLCKPCNSKKGINTTDFRK